MSKPLISTDVPGCREIVKDGLNGFLIPPRDSAQLARAMMRLTEMSPGEVQRMAAASRTRAEQEFDENIVIRRYLEALSELNSGRASQMDSFE